MILAFVLISLWLAIMLLVVVVCRMAATGDRALRVERATRGWEEEELSAPVEGRVAKSPFKVYRLREDRRARLQPTATQHVRDRPQ